MNTALNVEIRAAERADRETIVEYNQALAVETEDRKLATATLRRGVQAVLDGTRPGRYFVACQDGRMIAQLMITTEWSDWRNADFWWIQSVYVAPEFRRKGLFSMLYRHVERLARHDPDVCGLRLYVEKDNHRAAGLYRKLGMHGGHYRMMEIDFTRREANEQC